jgi:hypothetical protein
MCRHLGALGNSAEFIVRAGMVKSRLNRVGLLHLTSPSDVLHPKPPWPLPAVEPPPALVQAMSTCA